MALKFYTCVAKGLKLKVRKFHRLIPTFVEVTVEKLVGSLFSLILNRVKVELQGERLDSLQLFWGIGTMATTNESPITP